MSARISPAEKAALPVARAALESKDSAYGVSDTIVFALGAAGLLAPAEVVEAFDTAEAEEYPSGRVPRLRTALGVMQAARRKSPDGLVPLVWALENAGLLQSPETAAELIRLRDEVYRLSLPVDDPDRHALDATDVEFAELAPGRPEEAVAQ
ncbi:hypothetical protein [Actinacidiphila rubida]|uniref:Uncharacterized protein n=1 Tax=Actinacidiphila rubida TaxID=310780 RepID=A0A1H8SWP7_9ACTN|nr:hypothetical protein [Actinacidiphila rubida]SEO82758.1 hypothetical protein SAMN05216267_10466 [Actinacidiphila rubida]